MSDRLLSIRTWSGCYSITHSLFLLSHARTPPFVAPATQSTLAHTSGQLEPVLPLVSMRYNCPRPNRSMSLYVDTLSLARNTAEVFPFFLLLVKSKKKNGGVRGRVVAN